jgi:predicted nuclease of predicted toxin-antitoxin system
MEGRQKKSKKRCAANDGGKQPDPPVFFIDRALGNKDVPGILRNEGFLVEIHSDHFSHDAPDIEWLAAVGKRDWVVLSKDKKIRTRRLEREALLNANVAAFILTSGRITGEDMGRAFVKAHSLMLKFLSEHQRPFIAAVTRDGEVKLTT